MAAASHSAHGAVPQPLTAERATPLSGICTVPGDKSISHRALILGLLAVGETKVSGLLEGEDVLRTADAARALGATVEHLGSGSWRIMGVGVGSLLEPKGVLDFGNAGTGSRLMMGVCGSHPITTTFDGDASLRKRPMRRILDPLELMGARTLEQAEGGRCPILLQGAAGLLAEYGQRTCEHEHRLGAQGAAAFQQLVCGFQVAAHAEVEVGLALAADGCRQVHHGIGIGRHGARWRFVHIVDDDVKAKAQASEKLASPWRCRRQNPRVQTPALPSATRISYRPQAPPAHR